MNLILRCNVFLFFSLLIFPFLSRAQTDIGVMISTPAIVANDSNFTTTIVVVNNGPQAATNVTLTMGLYLGLKFVSFTAPAGWTNTISSNPDAIVKSSANSLASGETRVFTMVTTAALPSGAYPYLYITAAAFSGTDDPNTENNFTSFWPHVTEVPSSYLALSISSYFSTYVGTHIAFLSQVTNSGTEPLTSVTLTNALPDGLKFISLAAPDGWTTSTPTAGSGGTIMASTPLLNPGDVANFVVIAKLPDTVRPYTIIHNSSSVVGLSPDLVPHSNSSNSDTRLYISPYPDLAIVKQGPATAKAGDLITYNINVKNIGLDTARAVRWIDTLPPGLSIVSLKQNSNSHAWSLNIPATGSSGIVSAGTNYLEKNANDSFTLVVKLADGISGRTISNNVFVTTASVENNPDNNSSTAIANLIDTESPVITSCPSVSPLCFNNSNDYTTPKLTATDNFGAVITSYTISGATTRKGNGDDASGHFNQGTSTIIWSVKDSSNNSSTCTTTVFVNGPLSVTIPDASAFYTGVDANTIYRGYAPASKIILTARVDGGTAPYSYLWSNGDTTASIEVNASMTSKYTVTARDTYGCTMVSAEKLVKVVNVSCGTKNEKVQVCIVPPGNFSKSYSSCVDPNAVALLLNAGGHLGSCSIIEDYTLTLKASPNPTFNYFTLNIASGNTVDKITLNIYNLFGRLIETKVVNANSEVQIGKSYGSGVYLAEVTQGTKKATLLILKL